MKQKSLGVIGGMGPKATSVFFEKIVDNTVANNDQDHIDMVILNHASLPDRTNVILENQSTQFVELLMKDIHLLEKAEVSHIAIPCNTAHYFIDELQTKTTIPIINMVEETIREIQRKYGKGSKVGILATNGTIRSGTYKKACEKYGMELVVPDEAMQNNVMSIIYTNVKSKLNVDSTETEAIIHHLHQNEGCHCVILACTEFSCIELSEEIMKDCVDAMDILVNRSIRFSGKQSKIKPISK
ncbi:aspartate/glutamate racemase family protein [Alkalihalobacterium bogoriense]|uniref:aspartate/glutamate racemase family protein n=1 Tax=Alkalihalobacterium bogoriense TaxID=246272 RepID=UPI00047D1317|nr:amino acid racemase [Alkalihalobacterium bogoriense]